MLIISTSEFNFPQLNHNEYKLDASLLLNINRIRKTLGSIFLHWRIYRAVTRYLQHGKPILKAYFNLKSTRILSMWTKNIFLVQNEIADGWILTLASALFEDSSCQKLYRLVILISTTVSLGLLYYLFSSKCVVEKCVNILCK